MYVCMYVHIYIYIYTYIYICTCAHIHIHDTHTRTHINSRCLLYTHTHTYNTHTDGKHIHTHIIHIQTANTTHTCNAHTYGDNSPRKRGSGLTKQQDFVHAYLHSRTHKETKGVYTCIYIHIYIYIHTYVDGDNAPRERGSGLDWLGRKIGDGMPFCFAITSPTGQTFLFQAISENDRTSWVAAVQMQVCMYVCGYVYM
jgi:hypothetical protein